MATETLATFSTAVLGIDIGTTHTKICFLEQIPDGPRHLRQECHHGYKMALQNQPTLPSSHREQDTKALIQSIDTCLSYYGDKNFQISKIAVTGQMHGIVLWKPVQHAEIKIKKKHSNLISIMHDSVEKYSNLITWEDQRCDGKFLDSVHVRCHGKVATGYGIGSLLWLVENKKLEDEYSMCGTIMDFLVWLLTQTERVQMTEHNAKSWGLYKESTMDWEESL